VKKRFHHWGRGIRGEEYDLFGKPQTVNYKPMGENHKKRRMNIERGGGEKREKGSLRKTKTPPGRENVWQRGGAAHQREGGGREKGKEEDSLGGQT